MNSQTNPFALTAGVQGLSPQNSLAKGAAAKISGSAQNASASEDPAVKNFLDYMKETPAQRWEDQWLSAHGLTSKQLAAMPPAQRQAIENQMAQDIKAQVLKQTDAKLSTSLGGIS